jgi:E3 ubiquitin-protein ligase SspH2
MGQAQSNSNKVNNDNSDVVELLPSSESAKQTPLDKAYKIIEEYKRDLAVGKNKYFELYLSDLGLEEIPEIPASVEFLNLDGNKIKTISNLPKNLRTLYLNYNQITEIRNLPNKIELLYLNENQIKNVYNLPKNLKFLYMQNTKVTILIG